MIRHWYFALFSDWPGQDKVSHMQVIDTAFPEVKVLQPAKHGDERGFFSETFSTKALQAAGLVAEFVQDNQSLSVQAGVVRGLHFQLPPMAQDKLVRVLRGAIIDVAVDVRRGSPTFGKHIAVELSAENWRQLLVPRGFAHGFATLVPNTEVFYKVTAFYSPEHDRGIRWNDPALGIDWRVDPAMAILSGKDQKTPLLRDAVDLF
jgi:dTDP-4-dehydrorhamnose 3,5-epimerase